MMRVPPDRLVAGSDDAWSGRFVKPSIRRWKSLLLTLVAAAVTACAPIRMDFSLLARESDPFDVEVLERDVEARACSGWSAPPYSEVVASAIARVPGANAMTDVTFQWEYTDYWFWFRNCSVVRGDVGRVR